MLNNFIDSYYDVFGLMVDEPNIREKMDNKYKSFKFYDDKNYLFTANFEQNTKDIKRYLKNQMERLRKKEIDEKGETGTTTKHVVDKNDVKVDTGTSKLGLSKTQITLIVTFSILAVIFIGIGIFVYIVRRNGNRLNKYKHRKFK